MVWPTPAVVESIVQKSSGQFIYAATVVRFVQSIRHLPHHRLEIILKLRPVQGDMPFAQLDALYTMILSSAVNIERVLFAISVYSLRVEANDLDLSRYMSLDKEEIEILFCDLGALVSVEWNEKYHKTSLKILHASLHDFLLDPMRSKDFYISLDAYRTKHMIAILKYITPQLGESDAPNLSPVCSRYADIQYFCETNFPICEISAELVHQAFSFPLDQLFNILRKAEIAYANTDFLYFIFLPFIQRMVKFISAIFDYKLTDWYL